MAARAFLVLCVALLAACQGASSEAGREVTVLAAASLTETFGLLGDQFERTHPGSEVVFSFAGSAALATQVRGGVPADVFASASPRDMDAVVTAGLAADAAPFAVNRLEIAVPPDDPARIGSLRDLARPGVKVAVCQVEVPCGALTRTVLANAKITIAPVTEESDVKATLAKVRLGEVDAGLVYVTDVRAAGAAVLGVPIADDVNSSTEYSVAVLRDAPNPLLAEEFTDFLTTEQARAVLTAAGFGAP